MLDVNSFEGANLIEYRGYKIRIWSDSCLASMPPIPVYKAETDKFPVIKMEDIDAEELEKAMKLAIDKIEDDLKEESDV
jgi:hypothetical protein